MLSKKIEEILHCSGEIATSTEVTPEKNNEENHCSADGYAM
jgi:hypothetical protein